MLAGTLSLVVVSAFIAFRGWPGIDPATGDSPALALGGPDATRTVARPVSPATGDAVGRTGTTAGNTLTDLTDAAAAILDRVGPEFR